MINFLIAFGTIVGLAIIVIGVVSILIWRCNKFSDSVKEKPKNAGCENCTWYLEKDTGKYRLSKTNISGLIDENDPRAFHHCSGYYIERYNTMTGEITYHTTSCYTCNNHGYCPRFLHKDEIDNCNR